MSYAETVLPEFDQEMANTRKVLERIPDDKLDWQPHPKSHTIGWNANHLASLPDWLVNTIEKSSLDIAPVGGPRFQSPSFGQHVRRSLSYSTGVSRQPERHSLAAKDEDMAGMWTLLQGGNPIFSMPRSAVVRSFVLNHMVHHRAILCVYFRLNDIPVPGMYGPSGDE